MSSLAEEIRYTYKDYTTRDSSIRYELIDGIAYAMAAPSQIHQEVLGELHGRLWRFLRGKPCKVFVAPLAVRLNADSFDDVVVEPDILVVCDKSKLNGKSVKGAPDMIIEILSPYNLRHDTDRKFAQYERAGVKEYWIADPRNKTIQVYILENNKYGAGRVYRDDDIIPVNTLEGCQINLGDIFDTVEFEIDDSEDLIPKEDIIKALKKSGINDDQIDKIINSIIR
jgi:Uma2 family endonuclease